MNCYFPIKCNLFLLILMLAPDSLYAILQISRKTVAPYKQAVYDHLIVYIRSLQISIKTVVPYKQAVYVVIYPTTIRSRPRLPQRSIVQIKVTRKGISNI